MRTLPKIDRRGWLAAWAQGRRRARAALATLPPPAETFARLTEEGEQLVTEDGEQRTQE